MCKFHSCLGVAIRDQFELRHDPGNSHSRMAGSLINRDNRVPVIFEAEASAESLLSCQHVDAIKSSLIRNYAECPETLVNMIVEHYQKVKEALTDGSHMSSTGYFADTKKYADVWYQAQQVGVRCDFSGFTEFHGPVYAEVGATLTAPELTTISGSVVVHDGATLTAPELTTISGSVDVEVGGALTVPKLTKVSRYVIVREGATLNAPKLKIKV